jgi:hypothetical protein
LALFAVLGAACSGRGPIDAAPDPVTSLEFGTESSAGAASMIVNESALLAVIARTSTGAVVGLPWNATWDTSDAAVATISGDGVVTAHQRGLATIKVRVGDVSAEAAVEVKARVRIDVTSCSCAGDYLYRGDLDLRLAVGDTLLLSATYIDVDGNWLEEAETAVWTSSDPGTVSVNADGLVIGLTGSRSAEITAVAPDGSAHTQARVFDLVAGFPATVQFAHGALDLGAVTFVHNRGDPVTLEFGESVDIPVTTGQFVTYAPSLYFAGTLLGGDRLSLYFVGGNTQFGPRSALTWAWDAPAHVSQDSVRIRLVQGFSPFLAIHVLAPDAPADSLPDLCYFDPGDVWGYDTRRAGDIDIVLQGKFLPGFLQYRTRVSPQPGSSVTYVIAPAPPIGVGYSLVAFSDP